MADKAIKTLDNYASQFDKATALEFALKAVIGLCQEGENRQPRPCAEMQPGCS